MGDDYDYDGDDFMPFEDDWLYVEDDYAMADELAEGQIAEPGYSGTNAEIAMETYEFELHEYFEDLEYGDDSYWDYTRPLPKDGQTAQAGQKRKRGAVNGKATPDKRRKNNSRRIAPALDDRDDEPVLFHSQAERNRVYFAPAPLLKSKVTFAFLPDWRVRFAGADGTITRKEMPADMQKAAEAQDQETPPKRQRQVDSDEDDEEDDDLDDDVVCEAKGLPVLDPEMLKAILKQRLGDAGLEGMDEATCMQTIGKMLSGEGDADDAAGELANSLLGKVSSGGDEALSGWLSQQGVSLEDGDDDASSVATAELPDGSSSILDGQARQTRRSAFPSEPMPSRKRAASHMEDVPAQEPKKVKLNALPPSSSEVQPEDSVADLDEIDEQEIGDPLRLQTKRKAAAWERNGAKPDDDLGIKGRRAVSTRERKADLQAPEQENDQGGKKIKASPAPTVRKTRSAARGKAAK